MSGCVIFVFDKCNEKIVEVDGYIYWKNCCSSFGFVWVMGLFWLWDKYYLNFYNLSWKLLWVWVVGIVVIFYLYFFYNF